MESNRFKKHLDADRKRIFALLGFALLEMGISLSLIYWWEDHPFIDGVGQSLLILAGFHFFIGAIALNNLSKIRSLEDPYPTLRQESRKIQRHINIETLTFGFGIIFLLVGILLKSSLINVGIGFGISASMAISLIWWIIRKWHLDLLLEVES